MSHISSESLTYKVWESKHCSITLCLDTIVVTLSAVSHHLFIKVFFLCCCCFVLFFYPDFFCFCLKIRQQLWTRACPNCTTAIYCFTSSTLFFLVNTTKCFLWNWCQQVTNGRTRPCGTFCGFSGDGLYCSITGISSKGSGTHKKGARVRVSGRTTVLAALVS